MGGKDVIHLKQLQSSNLEPTDMQVLLKKLADERFSEAENEILTQEPELSSGKKKVSQFLDSLKYSKSTLVANPIYNINSYIGACFAGISIYFAFS